MKPYGNDRARSVNACRSGHPGYGMKAITMSVIFLLGFLAITAQAGEVREVELNDGSVISGEILSLSRGIYTVRTDSLGIVKLDESKIRAIRPRPQASSAQPAQSGSSPNEVQSLQQKMMSDQEIMGLIMSLQNDPEFKKILEDPDVMKAVDAGDVAALAANPKFMKLLNNATVQEIGSKVK